MHKKIAITGIGVIASNGIGKDAFWTAIMEGRSGIKPVSLFNTDSLRSKLAGEITDFRPEDMLGLKGLRNLDRSTTLALAATRLALKDAGLPERMPEEKADLSGVSLGSALGSVSSISDFDRESLKEGPHGVNPALFPNTVVNSPASQISIWSNIKGFNATISSGYCSSLDALFYATNMIDLYGYDTVLVGGVEELCEHTYKAFHRLGHLAGSKGIAQEVSRPFDRRRSGIIFGEGACIVVMEELGHALERGAHIYGLYLGYGTAYDPKSKRVCNPKADGAISAIKSCLDESRISPDDVDYISSSANSTPDCDAMESCAINSIFGKRKERVAVSAIKSMVGECFSASGAIGLAGALAALDRNMTPPTINYDEPDTRCAVDCIPGVARAMRVKTALVNAFSPTGSSSVIAVGRYG